MKNFSKILVTLFMLTVSCFTLFGCDGEKEEDKAPATEVKCDPACTENQECKMVDEKATCVEKVVEEVKCDPACDADKQECKTVEDKPVCVDKAPVVEEPECSEAKPCTDDKECQEGKCVAKAEEDPCKDKKENDECGENKICDKDLKCVDKPAEPDVPEQK